MLHFIYVCQCWRIEQGLHDLFHTYRLCTLPLNRPSRGGFQCSFPPFFSYSLLYFSPYFHLVPDIVHELAKETQSIPRFWFALSCTGMGSGGGNGILKQDKLYSFASDRYCGEKQGSPHTWLHFRNRPTTTCICNWLYRVTSLKSLRTSRLWVTKKFKFHKSLHWMGVEQCAWTVIGR